MNDKKVDVLGNYIDENKQKQNYEKYLNKIKKDEKVLRTKIRNHVMRFRKSDDFKTKKFDTYLKTLSFSYPQSTQFTENIKNKNFIPCKNKQDTYYITHFLRAFALIVESKSYVKPSKMDFETPGKYEILVEYDSESSEETRLLNFISLWQHCLSYIPPEKTYNKEYENLQDFTEKLDFLEAKLDQILSLLQQKL